MQYKTIAIELQLFHIDIMMSINHLIRKELKYYSAKLFKLAILLSFI